MADGEGIRIQNIRKVRIIFTQLAADGDSCAGAGKRKSAGFVFGGNEFADSMRDFLDRISNLVFSIPEIRILPMGVKKKLNMLIL